MTRWLRFAGETSGLMLLPTGAGISLIVGLWLAVFDRWPTANEVWGVICALASEVI